MTENVTDEIKKDVREQVKAEIKQEVLEETKKEIQSAAAPEWTKRIRFGGDIRLRYEGDFFDRNNGLFLNPSNPTQLLNSQTERDRFRVRARLGATADVTDNVEAGVRFSTGDTTEPRHLPADHGHLFQQVQCGDGPGLPEVQAPARPHPDRREGWPTHGSSPTSSGGATSPLTGSRPRTRRSSPIPSGPSSLSGPSPSRR